MTMKGPIQFGPTWSNTEHWCQYTYVNGYPVTTLADQLSRQRLLAERSSTASGSCRE